VQHSCPDFEMRQDEPIELDAFGLDRTIDQGMGAVIIAAGYRELKCHSDSVFSNHQVILRSSREGNPHPNPYISSVADIHIGDHVYVTPVSRACWHEDPL